MSLDDRALAALSGLALGDALGMPTQSMSPADIRATYGTITTLRDAAPHQPIAPNLSAGHITDDTEQAILVATLLINNAGTIDPYEFAEALAAWETAMRDRGSLDLLGPSTQAAIHAIRDGVDPQHAGHQGTTNGAAMRITPVAIATPANPPRLLEAVINASLVTHHTSLGLAGAAAVAAAISTGLEGGTTADATQAALTLAAEAQTHGTWVDGPLVAARLHWAIATVTMLSDTAALQFIGDVIGTSVATQESVVAALTLAHRFDDAPYAALCHAATLGGDTDTVAAILGAVLGARHGMAAWPEPETTLVMDVNALDLKPLVHRLLALRHPS